MERLNLTIRIEPGSPEDVLLEATLPHAPGHRDGDAAAAERMIAADPGLTSANLWVAAATGDLDAARTFLGQGHR